MFFRRVGITDDKYASQIHLPVSLEETAIHWEVLDRAQEDPESLLSSLIEDEARKNMLLEAPFV